MAIGWMSVLKMVPWGDVISNAPKVADSAKKLWNTVAGGKPSSAAESPGAGAPAFAAMPESEAIALLQSQWAGTEATVSELHRQMLASSELIAALAEQNTQLIKRVDANRVRVLWLSWISAGLVLAVVVNLALTLRP